MRKPAFAYAPTWVQSPASLFIEAQNVGNKKFAYTNLRPTCVVNKPSGFSNKLNEISWSAITWLEKYRNDTNTLLH